MRRSKVEYSNKELEKIENYLNGYLMNRKLLRLERYEREYFSPNEMDLEALGEGPLARARMFEIRHFIMSLQNSDEKLFLYYRYIKGESIENCAELLGIGRSTAYRLKKRALSFALEVRKKKEEAKAPEAVD